MLTLSVSHVAGSLNSILLIAFTGDAWTSVHAPEVNLGLRQSKEQLAAPFGPLGSLFVKFNRDLRF